MLESREVYEKFNLFEHINLEGEKLRKRDFNFTGWKHFYRPPSDKPNLFFKGVGKLLKYSFCKKIF